MDNGSMDKNRVRFSAGDNGRPDIEINRTTRPRFWQSPFFTLLAYLLFVFLSFLLWDKAGQEGSLEIPYSTFLSYVDQHKVAEAMVTDKLIVGTLRETDPETGKPRRFMCRTFTTFRNIRPWPTSSRPRGSSTVSVMKTTGSAISFSTGYCLSGCCSCCGAGSHGAWAA